jgi:renalase
MAEKRLLVVGAGLSGSLTAAILKRSSVLFNITVWDKARGAGGRMSTHRDPNNPGLSVDMGAQYISKTVAAHPQDAYECLRESVYEDLVSSHVLDSFCGQIEGVTERFTTSTVQNYISTQGLNSVVKHFLRQSGAEVSFQQHVSSLRSSVGKDASTVLVGCTNSDQERTFDGVILTMPVPQLLNLGGRIITEMDGTILANIRSVSYSTRYALGLFYKDAITRPESWSAKYFDDPTVRFAAWDTAKRGCTSHGSTLLLHTSVPFGIEHLEDDKEEVRGLIMHRAEELIPGLKRVSPTHSHVTRWRYSQVLQGYPGSPGCVVLSHDPLVVITGDAFCGSNFENCIRAAQITSQTVIKNMT